MNDGIKRMLREQPVQQMHVADIAYDLLESDNAARSNYVEPDHLAPLTRQAVGE
jgi:hypothetical protein